MVVWVTVLPALSVAVARSDTNPAGAAGTVAWPLVTGAVTHVFPSSKDASTVRERLVPADEPGCGVTVTGTCVAVPAGAVFWLLTGGAKRTVVSGSRTGVS